jgi:predicted permease
METYRDRRGLPLINGLEQDVRFALRLMRKDAWFTAAVVIALALGLAVSTTIATIVYGMNLRPMPFRQPASLVSVGAEPVRIQGSNVLVGVFDAWRARARSFAGMAAHFDAQVNVGDETHATDRFVATRISHDAFEILGERPLVGRGLLPEDERPGAPAVVVLGHGLWAAWYGSSPDAIGRTVRIDGEPATVIGVMRQGFAFPTWTDLWRPMIPEDAAAGTPPTRVRIFARLADGATADRARDELESIAATLPEMSLQGRTRRPLVAGLNESIVGRATDPVPLMLIAAVGVVLLVACAHAANLLLARSAVRAREISLRSAMGAGRGRIVRQLLVESVLLSMVAGPIGLALATLGVGWFANETIGFGLPFWTRFDLDARLVAGLAAMTLGTGILFGLLPAWHLSRTNLQGAINQAGRQGGAGPGARRMTSILLVGEIALTVILLTCAGLLVRSARVLSMADQTIDVRNLWEFRLSLPQPQYSAEERRVSLYRALDDRLASGPGWQSAALASAPPFVGGERLAVVMEGQSDIATENARTTRVIAIGDRYFATLGLAPVRGLGFDALDEVSIRDGALVNERFIEVFSPGQDVIGRRLRLMDERAPERPYASVTIRGVAPAIRQEQNGDHQPVVYLPHRLHPGASASVLVRGVPEDFAEALRQHVRALDRDLPIHGLRPLARVSDISRWYQRSSSLLFSAFAIVTVTLSALGLYAMTAYAVAQRTQEVGVRMAVGARAGQVQWLFIRRSLAQMTVGLGLGIVGAIGAGTLLRGLLIRTSAVDPATLGGVSLLLFAVALTASLLPARRAARLDPIATLRHD